MAKLGVVTTIMSSGLMPAAPIAAASRARSSASPSAPVFPAEGIGVRPLRIPAGAVAVAAALLNSATSSDCAADTASASPKITSAFSALAALSPASARC